MKLICIAAKDFVLGDSAAVEAILKQEELKEFFLPEPESPYYEFRLNTLTIFFDGQSIVAIEGEPLEEGREGKGERTTEKVTRIKRGGEDAS